MDTNYWNATLRSDSFDFSICPETVHVMSSGLVALSLSGNKFTGENLSHISQVLARNFWFLGKSIVASTSIDYDCYCRN